MTPFAGGIPMRPHASTCHKVKNIEFDATGDRLAYISMTEKEVRLLRRQRYRKIILLIIP